VLEDALDNLAFTEGEGFFGLLDVEEMIKDNEEGEFDDYLDDWDEFDDLEDEDED
jgi:hypothetical protein